MLTRYFNKTNFEISESDIRKIKQNADSSCVKSMYNLAIIYLDSTHKKQNSAFAKHWLQLAAKDDYIPAMIQLAYIFLDERNPELNIVGITWLERGATMGSKECRNLMRYYQSKNIK
jgi:TPR repeat protein